MQNGVEQATENEAHIWSKSSSEFQTETVVNKLKLAVSTVSKMFFKQNHNRTELHFTVRRIC